MLIDSVDPNNPQSADGIVWMSNPFEIALVFGMAIVGMFAFSSVLQGYFVTKVRIWERALLILVVPLAMVPNICARYGIVPNEYAGYAIGAAIYAFVFVTQWMKSKKDKAALALTAA